LFKSESKDINGNTLLEEVCIRLTWHLHNHDMTYVMNMMWGGTLIMIMMFYACSW